MRKQLIYKGHVQGVGFRYQTLSIARQFSVFGFVKNKTDGSVELIVEGEPSELSGFIVELESRLAVYIRSRIEIIEADIGQFSSFTIMY